VLAAVPMGRNAICYEGFDLTHGEKPASIFGPVATRTIPVETLSCLDLDYLIAHESICGLLTVELPDLRIHNAGSNISALIASAAAVHELQKTLDPIFLSLAA
jgi:hypothetical protein